MPTTPPSPPSPPLLGGGGGSFLAAPPPGAVTKAAFSRRCAAAASSARAAAALAAALAAKVSTRAAFFAFEAAWSRSTAMRRTWVGKVGGVMERWEERRGTRRAEKVRKGKNWKRPHLTRIIICTNVMRNELRQHRDSISKQRGRNVKRSWLASFSSSFSPWPWQPLIRRHRRRRRPWPMA